MRDLFNSINPIPLFAPAAAITDNTALVSNIIDRHGFEALVLAFVTGNDADADATFAVTLAESDASNMAGSNAVAAGDMLGTLALAGYTFADDNKARKLGYVGNKRYVQMTITPANNTGNVFVGGLAILGRPQQKPTVNPPA